MNRSPVGNNGGAPAMRVWFRRVHRWFGVAAILFVLLLSATGIALNHTAAWQLDERHVRWSWLLDLYGIEAPEPSASFTHGGQRATLLGSRLYLNGRELARDIGDLTGLVAAGEYVVVATAEDVFVLTASGELVERLALTESLPGDIAAVGTADTRVILRSRDGVYRFDEDLLQLESLADTAPSDIQWSSAAPVPPEQLAALQDLYRGRGVTVERLLADLHSGRILTRLGPFFMDAIAVLLILLSVTGLVMWLQRGGNGNNNRKNGSRHF